MHFESAAKMLDFFRLSKDGRHYRRIIQGFQRIFARFEKLDVMFIGFIHFALIVEGLRFLC